MKEFVKYVIKSNHTNSTFDIFEKDHRGGLTFHSSHDTLEKAESEKDKLKVRPSKIETLNFLRDLMTSMK